VATTKIAIFHGGPFDRHQNVVERFTPTVEFAVLEPLRVPHAESQDQFILPSRAIYRTFTRPIPIRQVWEFDARWQYIPDQEVALYVYVGTR